MHRCLPAVRDSDERRVRRRVAHAQGAIAAAIELPIERDLIDCVPVLGPDERLGMAHCREPHRLREPKLGRHPSLQALHYPEPRVPAAGARRHDFKAILRLGREPELVLAPQDRLDLESRELGSSRGRRGSSGTAEAKGAAAAAAKGGAAELAVAAGSDVRHAEVTCAMQSVCGRVEPQQSSES